MELEIHDSPEAAGVYRLIEEKFYVDDVIDPSLVKQIREFDKEYVPLLCKRLYRSPAGTAIHKQYHLVGRHIAEPTDDYAFDTVKLEHVPPGFQYNPKKIHSLRVLWAPWPKGTTEWKLAMPPAEIKPEGWLVEQLRAVHKFFDIGISLSEEDGELHQDGNTESTKDKLNQILQAEQRRDEKIMADALAEARYRMRHNWRQFKEAADKERWAPEPPDAAPKPFVDLKGKP